MNIDELSALVREYLLTLDNLKRDESYCTERASAESELERFIDWLSRRAEVKP